MAQAAVKTRPVYGDTLFGLRRNIDTPCKDAVSAPGEKPQQLSEVDHLTKEIENLDKLITVKTAEKARLTKHIATTQYERPAGLDYIFTFNPFKVADKAAECDRKIQRYKHKLGNVKAEISNAQRDRVSANNRLEDARIRKQAYVAEMSRRKKMVNPTIMADRMSRMLGEDINIHNMRVISAERTHRKLRMQLDAHRGLLGTLKLDLGTVEFRESVRYEPNDKRGNWKPWNRSYY
ncbi:hypothetical protein [Roseibium aggregatum]|jgi:chromosome segregation ATPase|uniref:Uncharacterized protein n=1 Tax=Roseibium aggregatum TaxID=187304 RepID=A0A0M6YCU1_9HYPH|nr:hypothetical protein [Roseibium aggregatum]CTQ47239.1 hypothetical protein LAL4801_05701 [Roseibium aggregatum]